MDTISKKYIIRIWTSSPALRGRAGAIRLKSKAYDITLVGLHYCPNSRDGRDRHRIENTTAAFEDFTSFLLAT
eukprot:5079133-Pyramimonas_sp.AAC.1